MNKSLLQKVSAVLLAFAFVFGCFIPETQVSFAAGETSGKCGDGISWEYDSTSGRLILTGSGIMTDYDGYNTAPWASFRTDITEITVSDGIKNIGDYAFSYCTALLTVSLPESLEKIGKFSFAYCSSLAEAVIPDNVTVIGEGSFGACINLQSVGFGDSVSVIEKNAFNYCIRLNNPVLPDGLEQIGENVFDTCVGINELVIPEGVISIGANAFINCIGLEKLTVMSRTVDISSAGFGYADNIYSDSDESTFIQSSLDEAGAELPQLRDKIEIIREKSNSGTEEKVTAFLSEIDAYPNSPASVYCESMGLDFVPVAAECEHTPVIINDKAASCTEDGYTGDTVCSECGEVLQNGTVIPPTGHRFENYVYDNNATVFSDGTKTSKCTYCDATDTVPMKGTRLKVSVKFFVDGTEYYSYSCYCGENVVLPEMPQKEYYDFAGWTPAVPETVGESDMVFNAVFTPTEYYVAFVADGEEVSRQIYTVENKTVTVPVVPQKPCLFNGRWERFDLTSGNITVNAIYDRATTVIPVRKSIQEGKTYRILASSNFTVTAREWKSCNESTVSVDSHGNITAVSEGECDVILTTFGTDSFGNAVSDTVSVTVTVYGNDTDDSFSAKIEAFFRHFIKDFVFNLASIIKAIIRLK